MIRRKLKVVVLGGSGFIGSNICLRLLNKGHEVICIDNLSTGSKSNMMEFLFNPLFHFIVHDITSPISISGIDIVIHCATPDLTDPLHFLKTCSYGTFTAAGIARRNNSKLICLSSDKVYGSEGVDDTLEISNDIWNADTYSIGINTMETILKNYSSLDIKILRLYNIYGPKMNINSFIYSALKIIQNGEDILINHHPSSEICSCFVDDLVDAICCLMDMQNPNSIFNIGSSKSITLLDFFNIAKIVSESKSNITYLLNEDSDIVKLGHTPDISSITSKLKWKQKIDYKTGISRILDFIKSGPDRDYNE